MPVKYNILLEYCCLYRLFQIKSASKDGHLWGSLPMERIRPKSSSAFAGEFCSSNLFLHPCNSDFCQWNYLVYTHTWKEPTRSKISATENSLHYNWVQPYWLESSEDPKIFQLVIPSPQFLRWQHFGICPSMMCCCLIRTKSPHCW